MGMMIGSAGRSKRTDAGKVKAQTLQQSFEKYNAEKANTIVKHTVDYLPSSNMAYSAIFDDSEDRFNGAGYSDLQAWTEYSELNQHTAVGEVL
jgi:hypothetical protein